MNDHMKNQTLPGRRVWGKEEEQTTESNLRYITKLENHLKMGKVLLGRPDANSVADNGREISTVVALRRPAENQFVVQVEVYYTGMDIAGNLSNEDFAFATLEEAMAFIHRKIGIRFDQMYINSQNYKPIKKQ